MVGMAAGGGGCRGSAVCCFYKVRPGGGRPLGGGRHGAPAVGGGAGADAGFGAGGGGVGGWS